MEEVNAMVWAGEYRGMTVVLEAKVKLYRIEGKDPSYFREKSLHVHDCHEGNTSSCIL